MLLLVVCVVADADLGSGSAAGIGVLGVKVFNTEVETRQNDISLFSCAVNRVSHPGLNEQGELEDIM